MDRRNGREYPEDVQRMRDHLYALSVQYGVAMAELDKHCGGDIDDTQYHAVAPKIGAGSVNIPQVECERDYAIALHEFGHVLAKGGHGIVRRTFCPCPKHRHQCTTMDMYDQLGEEIVAWTWARAHATVWTEAMQTARDFATQTYLDGVAIMRMIEDI